MTPNRLYGLVRAKLRPSWTGNRSNASLSAFPVSVAAVGSSNEDGSGSGIAFADRAGLRGGLDNKRVAAREG